VRFVGLGETDECADPKGSDDFEFCAGELVFLLILLGVFLEGLLDEAERFRKVKAFVGLGDLPDALLHSTILIRSNQN
jgi:hypothetical protein